MIRILFVDDHSIILDGITPILNAQPDMLVVGSASSVRAAIEQSKTLQPDLVLLDFGLPDGSGLDAMQAILADRPETKIIFITMHADGKLLMEAIRGGAKGYLVKDVSINEMLEFIRNVHSGKAAISPGMVSTLFDEVSRLPTQPG